MKLYYCKAEFGQPSNFGDALNDWIWEKWISNILDEDEKIIFVGIGTLINQRIVKRNPNALFKIVFSSGVGYGNKLRQIDNTYKFYCVRGPLSAQALGLPANVAVADGAILLRRLFQPKRQTMYKYSYMPHFNFAGEGWKLVCEQLNFGYIDPRWSSEKIISSISQTEVLLTEAMHGAIVADAFRVPWVPIVSHPTILQFKWQDWCASMNLEYQPMFLNRLHHPRTRIDLFSPIRSMRDWYRQKVAASELESLAKNSRAISSEETHLETLTVELEERLEQFKRDVQSGYFSKLLKLVG